jgi:hypothetical protein
LANRYAKIRRPICPKAPKSSFEGGLRIFPYLTGFLSVGAEFDTRKRAHCVNSNGQKPQDLNRNIYMGYSALSMIYSENSSNAQNITKTAKRCQLQTMRVTDKLPLCAKSFKGLIEGTNTCL